MADSGKPLHIQSAWAYARAAHSRRGLWHMFLMCAFPLHLWMLLLAFQDLGWLAERTNAWDAIGVLSYGMVFTLIESALLFLIAALLGLLVSWRFDEELRVALISVLFLVAAGWGMLGQVFFLAGAPLPVTVIAFLARTAPSLPVLYLIALMVVTPTVLVPGLLILHSDRVRRAVQELIDRVVLLSSFYLLLDLIGVGIVVIRNAM